MFAIGHFLGQFMNFVFIMNFTLLKLNNIACEIYLCSYMIKTLALVLVSHRTTSKKMNHTGDAGVRYCYIISLVIYFGMAQKMPKWCLHYMVLLLIAFCCQLHDLLLCWLGFG